MLRIRRFLERGTASFALSGRIDGEHVPELKFLLESELQLAGISLDLQEVRLVDRDAVRFLAACETRGVQLKNCPSYVREWIEQGGNKS